MGKFGSKPQRPPPKAPTDPSAMSVMGLAPPERPAAAAPTGPPIPTGPKIPTGPRIPTGPANPGPQQSHDGSNQVRVASRNVIRFSLLTILSATKTSTPTTISKEGKTEPLCPQEAVES